MNAIAFVHEQLTGNKVFPKFKAGDNITVNYKIIEGNKERIQSSIVLNKTGNVRRAKLFYQRSRSGKSARIREKRMAVATSAK